MTAHAQDALVVRGGPHAVVAIEDHLLHGSARVEERLRPVRGAKRSEGTGSCPRQPEASIPCLRDGADVLESALHWYEGSAPSRERIQRRFGNDPKGPLTIR